MSSEIEEIAVGRNCRIVSSQLTLRHSRIGLSTSSPAASCSSALRVVGKISVPGSSSASITSSGGSGAVVVVGGWNVMGGLAGSGGIGPSGGRRVIPGSSWAVPDDGASGAGVVAGAVPGISRTPEGDCSAGRLFVRGTLAPWSWIRSVSFRSSETAGVAEDEEGLNLILNAESLSTWSLGLLLESKSGSAAWSG